MEAEVDKLELMTAKDISPSHLPCSVKKNVSVETVLSKTKFQRADSDLDYIQYKLEYEIKTNHPDSSGEKNAVAILKELSAIKSRYQALCTRFKPVSVEQKETKSRICATLNKTMTTIQELQKRTDVELTLLTDEEKAVTEQLKSPMPDL